MKSEIYIPLGIIILCILYFIYRYYQKRDSMENFEVMSQRSDSIYYRNTVDANTLEILQKALNTKQDLVHLSSQVNDPFTGAWSNFSESNNTSATITISDMILLLRKIDSQLFVALTRRDLNQNNGGQEEVSGELYPMFMFVGLAKIISPTHADIHKVIDNKFTTVTSTTPNTISFSNNTVTLKLYGITYSFNLKRELTKENYYNPLQVILPAFKTTATSLTDVVCPAGKSQCTLTLGDISNQKVCAPSSSINTDGSCMTPTSSNTSDYCSLEENDITSGTITISKCPMNFNVIQNNIDYMMNNIFTGKNGSGEVQTCTYLDNLTKWKYYIVLNARDSKNFTIFGYQIWGLEPKDNKVVTKASRIANMISSKIDKNEPLKTQLQEAMNEGSTPSIDTSTLQTSSNEYPQLWKFNKAYNQGSCYFTLESAKTASQPIYYLNYKSDGDLFMTLQSGGFNQFFTMEDFKEIYTPTSGKYGLYGGYFKAANHFYISPGRVDMQELNPNNTQVNIKVCNLVSKINQAGKWLILGFNDEPNTIINQI